MRAGQLLRTCCLSVDPTSCCRHMIPRPGRPGLSRSSRPFDKRCGGLAGKVLPKVLYVPATCAVLSVPALARPLCCPPAGHFQEVLSLSLYAGSRQGQGACASSGPSQRGERDLPGVEQRRDVGRRTRGSPQVQATWPCRTTAHHVPQPFPWDIRRKSALQKNNVILVVERIRPQQAEALGLPSSPAFCHFGL